MNKKDYDTAIKKKLNSSKTIIPHDVQNRIDQTLQLLPIKNPFYKKIAYTACACFLFLACIIGIGFFSPTMAQTLQKLPFVGTIFLKAGDKGLGKASVNSFTSNINQIVTDQNLSLNINEVLYDGYRLSISYDFQYINPEKSGTKEDVQQFNKLVDGQSIIQLSFQGQGQVEEIKEEDFLGISEMKLFINGEELPEYWASTNIEKIQPNQYIGIASIDIDEHFPEEFDLSLTVNRVGQTNGTWSFSIPVSRTLSDSKSYVFYPQEETKIGDITISMNEVALYPSATRIQFRIKQPKSSSFFNDYNHNKIMFRFLDHSGEPLDPLGREKPIHTENEFEDIYEVSSYIEALPNQPSHITLSPIILNNDPLEFDSIAMKDLPVTLDQGEIGSITVTNLEHHGDKTIVTIEADGYDPEKQANHVWFEDQFGFKIRSKEKAKPLLEDERSFTLEFPLLTTKGELRAETLKMGLDQLFKDFEWTIPLGSDE